ncbi:MAG: hypothetical protein FWE71_03925 [Nocardioidaceae bacterium]|nr:hypothetical protein [Nocardioidaceae bacterium]
MPQLFSGGRAVGAIAALAVALSALVTFTAPAHAGGSMTTVSSGDGLSMTVSSRGTVASTHISGRQVSGRTTASLFSIRRVGGTSNLLRNPSLESPLAGDQAFNQWHLIRGSFAPQWVSGVAHSGHRSVRFRSATVGTSSTLQQTIAVKPGTSYTASSWMRSQDVKPTVATAEPGTGPSPVRLKVQQLVGSQVVRTDQAFGYSDTADWYRKFVGFTTGNDVTSVRVSAQVVDGSGTVWFDDLQVTQLFGHPWGSGRGTVTKTRGGAHFTGAASGLGITASLASQPGDIRINGTVSSSTKADVPFQLRVAVPLDAVGWSWWDDPRHSRTIEAGRTYDYLTQWNLQQTSRYPFNTVSDGRSALTIGVPLDQPKLEKAVYAAGRLDLIFDLGVSPATTGLGGAKVPFSLVLYKSDPSWGYRAAIAKYYQLFPSSFRRRTKASREGGWFGEAQRSALDTTSHDFGLGLNMIALGTGNGGGNEDWGGDYLPWDNARGIYTTAYNHHWGYKHPTTGTGTPSYAAEMRSIRTDAARRGSTYSARRLRDRSIASLNSGARDNNNRYLYARYRGYMQHYENLDPLKGKLDWRSVSRTYQMDPALAEAHRLGAKLDAIHLDSVSGMRRWGAADDYYKPHWANAPYGLTFSYDSGLVVDRLAFGVAAQLKYVSDFTHAHGMFLSANFNGSDARSAAWFGASSVDYFGLEQGLPEKASGENDPYSTVDGYALSKRVLADQRPVSTLDAGCDLRSADDLRQRFDQTLLYGIYMGCGGTTTWNETERSVFAKYTPLIREIDTAGWQVVTLARASNPAIQVERFGSLATNGAVWLVVHNPTDTPQQYTMTVEGSAVGGLAASGLEGEDRITGEPVDVTPAATKGDVAFGGALAPETSALVRLQPATS